MTRQPAGNGELEGRAEPKHKYGIGTIVHLVAGPMERSAARGSYKIVAQLPGNGIEFSYRIKSVNEPHERVAVESQLSR